jgi:hypothetical protein
MFLNLHCVWLTKDGFKNFTHLFQLVNECVDVGKHVIPRSNEQCAWNIHGRQQDWNFRNSFASQALFYKHTLWHIFNLAPFVLCFLELIDLNLFYFGCWVFKLGLCQSSFGWAIFHNVKVKGYGILEKSGL